MINECESAAEEPAELLNGEVDKETESLAQDVVVQKPAKKIFEAELMRIPHKPLWPTKTRIPSILQHLQAVIEAACSEEPAPDAETGNICQNKQKVGSEDSSSDKSEVRSASPGADHAVEGGGEPPLPPAELYKWLTAPAQTQLEQSKLSRGDPWYSLTCRLTSEKAARAIRAIGTLVLQVREDIAEYNPSQLSPVQPMVDYCLKKQEDLASAGELDQSRAE